MTQQPGPWGQGGAPQPGPAGPPPGYPQGQPGHPQGQPGPAGPPPGYPQGQPVHPPGQPGYGGQPGFGPGAPRGGRPGYPPGPPPYGAPPGYGPQGPPPYGGQGYGQQPPWYPGGRGPGGPLPPKKKSAGLILGLVGGALALLVLIGGIALVFGGDGGDQPTTTISPGPPTPPPDDPTTDPTTDPSTAPTDRPSTSSSPEPDPTPSSGGRPAGDAIDLGNDIALLPADGWEVAKTGKGLAQLSSGDEIFLGQAVELETGTNPGQLCSAWHKQVAEGAADAGYADPKKVDLGTSKLSGASCLAQVTVSSGQGSSEILVYSLVSVRKSDGVTVLGTVYFSAKSDTEAVNTDFSAMVGSMLETQVAG